MREWGDLSTTLFGFEAYSPTRQAGWGLNRGQIAHFLLVCIFLKGLQRGLQSRPGVQQSRFG